MFFLCSRLDRTLFDGIRSYQKDKGLTVDGYMLPAGETEQPRRLAKMATMRAMTPAQSRQFILGLGRGTVAAGATIVRFHASKKTSKSANTAAPSSGKGTTTAAGLYLAPPHARGAGPRQTSDECSASAVGKVKTCPI